MPEHFAPLELDELLALLRERGHGPLLDVLTLDREGPFTKTGRVNKSRLSKLTGIVPLQINQRLDELRKDALVLTNPEPRIDIH